jgi:3-hydroxyisobutyrate dehydrogenase
VSDVKIGWVGTGVMGASMCGHLLAAGHPVSVYTRSKEKATDLISRGATWVASPAEAAATSDVTFAIVGFPSDVREVFLGDNGIVAGATDGSLIIDMTTSEPSLAVEIADAARAKGVGSIDAPVSGGDVGAKNAALSIMVGGDEEDVARARPLFELMGKAIVLQGGPGAGQHTKMVNQIVIASAMMGIAEGLLYAKQAGLDLSTVLESISGGAAGSWSLSNLAPRVVDGNFDPGFYVDHFVKDMGIALDEARAMQLSTPSLALAHQMYVALQSQGGGLNGTQAIVKAMAHLSDIDW